MWVKSHLGKAGSGMMSMQAVRSSFGRFLVFLILSVVLVSLEWTVRAAEPSFDLTARYILEIVRAFRTAYVLKVVEHARDSGIRPHEDWQKDAHFIPLPAQFVKAAADQIEAFEIGLISLTPLNPANQPKTQAETDALMRLSGDRERSEEHTSELQSPYDLVCRLLLEKK